MVLVDLAHRVVAPEGGGGGHALSTPCKPPEGWCYSDVTGAGKMSRERGGTGSGGVSGEVWNSAVREVRGSVRRYLLRWLCRR